MARKITKVTELCVFKGREAKLNRAVFQILSREGPKTIYDTHKMLKQQKGLTHIHYSNVNKRMRCLEREGYLRVVDVLPSKSGAEKILYGLTIKTHLALNLDVISKEEILNQGNETIANQILGLLETISKQHKT